MPKRGLPIRFKADNGKTFNVKVSKTTIRCYWLDLYTIPDNIWVKCIKVRKSSPKLVYEEV
jgi:hypothetical protein